MYQIYSDEQKGSIGYGIKVSAYAFSKSTQSVLLLDESTQCTAAIKPWWSLNYNGILLLSSLSLESLVRLRDEAVFIYRIYWCTHQASMPTDIKMKLFAPLVVTIYNFTGPLIYTLYIFHWKTRAVSLGNVRATPHRNINQSKLHCNLGYTFMYSGNQRLLYVSTWC